MNIDLHTHLTKKVYQGRRIRVEHLDPIERWATYEIFIDDVFIGVIHNDNFSEEGLKSFLLKHFPDATFNSTRI